MDHDNVTPKDGMPAFQPLRAQGALAAVERRPVRAARGPVAEPGARAGETTSTFAVPARLRELLDTVRSRLAASPGLFLLTGEAGIGKTRLLRRLVEDLRAVGHPVAVIDRPDPSFRDIAVALAARMAVPLPAEPAGESGPWIKRFHALTAKVPGLPLVAAVDDAETLGPEVQQGLAALLASRDGTVRVLLVGRPETLAWLDRPEFAPARRRIAWQGRLERLSDPEIATLIADGLLAGGQRTALPFAADAVATAARLAGGVPRRAALLCARSSALAQGHAAEVSADIVWRAARELMLDTVPEPPRIAPAPKRRRSAAIYAAGGVIIVLGLLAPLFLPNGVGDWPRLFQLHPPTGTVPQAVPVPSPAASGDAATPPTLPDGPGPFADDTEPPASPLERAQAEAAASIKRGDELHALGDMTGAQAAYQTAAATLAEAMAAVKPSAPPGSPLESPPAAEAREAASDILEATPEKVAENVPEVAESTPDVAENVPATDQPTQEEHASEAPPPDLSPPPGGASQPEAAVAASPAPEMEEASVEPPLLAPPSPEPPPLVVEAMVSPPPAPAATPARPDPTQPDPTQPNPAAELPSEVVAALLRRGNELLTVGDVSGARLAYRRAADGGSGRAALLLGKTYDPAFLKEIGARGIRPQAERAVAWYEKAAALGEAEASSRLARLKTHQEK